MVNPPRDRRPEAREKRSDADADEFARLAGARRASFAGDLFYLLKNNKKWWMLPLIGLLLLFGVLMFLAATGVAPYIYTLF